MEALSQVLQDVLGATIAVHLGPEYLISETELPHVIVVPTREAITSPTQPALLAEAAQAVDVVCRAGTFTDARELALLCWSLLLPLRAKTTADIKYGSEVWGDYNVRSATLTVTMTIPILKTDVTLARIEEIAAHHRFTIPTTQEVPNDQNTEGGTYRGDFHEHGDPTHRFPTDE